MVQNVHCRLPTNRRLLSIEEDPGAPLSHESLGSSVLEDSGVLEDPGDSLD